LEFLHDLIGEHIWHVIAFGNFVLKLYWE
jgi:hypothetical protein